LYHHDFIEQLFNIYKNYYETHLYIGEFVNSYIDISGKNIHLIPQPIRVQKFKLKGIKHLLFQILDFFEFLKNSIKLIIYVKKEKPDIIHFNTLENPFMLPLLNLILFTYKGKIAVTLQETQLWGANKNKFNLYDHLLYQIYKIPFRLLSKKISYFLILGEYIKIPKILKKKTYFVLNNRQIELQNYNYKYIADRVIFTITGRIETKLKNYQLVFKAFNNLLTDNPQLKKSVKLMLLGRVKERVIYDMIKQYNLTESTILFNEFIDDKTFKDLLMKTDFIIIPTYRDSPYGSTKISGSFGDAVSFGIPFLLPNYYAESFTFPENIIRFHEKSLEKTLIDCIKIKFNENEYMELRRKAIDYSKAINEKMKKIRL